MSPSRPTSRPVVVATVALCIGLAAPSARAQGTSPNVVLAEQLFHEGQSLLEQSKADDTKTHLACEKFAESERLQHAIGTLLNLALCHEKEKKTASAWAEYTQVAGQASRAGQPDRAQFASDHAAALDKHLSRLRLEMVSPPAGSDVKIDGLSLGSAVWGTDIPLDPGPHHVTVAATGKKSWERDVTLGGEGTVDREVVPALEDDAHAPTPIDTRPVNLESDSGSSGRHTAGYVVAGVGVAALATGITLLVRGGLYSSQSTDEANKATGINKATFSAASASDHSAGVANTAGGAVATGIGAVAVGVGLYLAFTSPKANPATTGSLRIVPDLGPRRAGASVGFDF